MMKLSGWRCWKPATGYFIFGGPRISSKLTQKAQTTIPQPIRHALHLQPGDEVVYSIEGGSSHFEPRPALVVTADSLTEGLGLLWVLMVTSTAKRGWEGDVAVPATEESGLPAPSIVRTATIATIGTKDAEPIGRLPLGLRGQIEAIPQRRFEG
jgi:mRNA-degrading endonuclease toxin of MazEF toxin-antitoxin module